MEFVLPVILFAAGFGVALLLRRVFSQLSAGRGGSREVPVKKGAVRLDQVPKKGKQRTRTAGPRQK